MVDKKKKKRRKEIKKALAIGRYRKRVVDWKRTGLPLPEHLKRKPSRKAPRGATEFFRREGGGRRVLRPVPKRFWKRKEEMKAPPGTAEFFTPGKIKGVEREDLANCRECGKLVPKNELWINSGYCTDCVYNHPRAIKLARKRAKARARERGVESSRETSIEALSIGRIKSHILEVAIPLIIGTVLSLFGFIFLGIAISLIGFYILARRTPAGGPMKFTIILLAAIQFILITQNFIALAILWVGYFLFPTSYNEGDSVKGSEAWSRFILGFALSFILFFVLGGTISLNSPQIPLLLMSIAFFTTFPYVKPREGGTVISLVGPKGVLYGMGGRRGGAAWYMILMFLALGFIISTWGLDLSGTLAITLIIFWVMSFAFGLLAGRQGRSYIGVLMMVIALLIFSFQFTGTVGQAMFGMWWPQVQSFGEMAFGPIGPLLNQASQGISDAWLMMSCPQCYYEEQLRRQQAGSSVIKTGGSIKSIELRTFDLFSAFLEPTESLLGYIELENQGEFNADRLEAEIYATWLSPTASRLDQPEEIGDVGTMSCSGTEGEKGSTGRCEWEDTTYPTEIQTISFKFNKNEWKDGVDLSETYRPEGGDYEIYKHAGETVKINLDYEFDYNVNVSIPLEVINRELYETLLKNRQITIQNITSEYSGGPVKATIWSQGQPIRNEEESLVVVSLLNEGQGNVTNVIEYSIYVPQDLEPQEIEYSNFDDCEEGDNFTEITAGRWEGYKSITCSRTRSIKSNNFARVSFLVKPGISSEIDRRTFDIIGLAKYTYSGTDSKSLQVANAPLQ